MQDCGTDIEVPGNSGSWTRRERWKSTWAESPSPTFPNPSIRFLGRNICCDSDTAFLDSRLHFRCIAEKTLKWQLNHYF
jgi:hypothetical protein